MRLVYLLPFATLLSHVYGLFLNGQIRTNGNQIAGSFGDFDGTFSFHAITNTGGLPDMSLEARLEMNNFGQLRGPYKLNGDIGDQNINLKLTNNNQDTLTVTGGDQEQVFYRQISGSLFWNS